jgi:hypothetical protein
MQLEELVMACAPKHVRSDSAHCSTMPRRNFARAPVFGREWISRKLYGDIGSAFYGLHDAADVPAHGARSVSRKTPLHSEGSLSSTVRRK